MVQYAKELGLLWAFCVSCVLINAADERGRSTFLDQSQGSVPVPVIGLNHISISSSSGSSNINFISSSGSSSMTIQSNVVSNNNHNNGSSLNGNFQGCENYTEYKAIGMNATTLALSVRTFVRSLTGGEGAKQPSEDGTSPGDLLHWKNNRECHSLDTVFAKLRALHERSPLHGSDCMHDAIGKLKTYFAPHRDNFERCTCSGHVVFHPEIYHNDQGTCKNRSNQFDHISANLYMDNKNTAPCVTPDIVWSHFSSLPTHLDTNLDCQWEIINHYTTILDANGPRCSCSHESMNIHSTSPHTDSMSTTMSPTTSKNTPMNIHTTPPHTDSTSTTMSPTTSQNTPTLTVPHTCKKASTISTLGHGIKQTNPEAGNCHPETNDHVAPDALVMNMCSVTSHSETWRRGQNVMSVCEQIPLYTPVATFFDGKYSNQGGLAGIFVGCLLDGFKMIVQECDKNITVMHVVTGGHFQLDPVNYSIIM